MRSAGDIINAISLAQTAGTSAVVSVTNANNFHPAKLKLIVNGVLKPYLGDTHISHRRQEFGFDVYKTNGAIYLARRDVLLEQDSFYGDCPRPLVMPPERSVDIDTRLDFEIAEILYQKAPRRRSAGAARMQRASEVIHISGREIRQYAPALVIAEVAQAHDGSLGFAHSFIDIVAEAGADAVKFQTHLAAAEFDDRREVPSSFQL